MAFNVIDILLLLVVILAVLGGYARGFILGLRDLAGWVLSLLIALRFYQPIARRLVASPFYIPQVWGRPIVFILFTVLVITAVHLIARAILSRMSKDAHERTVNRLFGVLPGLVNGLIIAAIISALLLTTPLSDALRDRARASASVNALAVYTERLEALLHPVFGEAIAETLNLLTVKPESKESVSLPYKVTAPSPRPDLEAKMLELVNGERVKVGLRPLVADPELTEVARRHSIDMFARGYFAHVTPEGKS